MSTKAQQMPFTASQIFSDSFFFFSLPDLHIPLLLLLLLWAHSGTTAIRQWHWWCITFAVWLHHFSFLPLPLNSSQRHRVLFKAKRAINDNTLHYYWFTANRKPLWSQPQPAWQPVPVVQPREVLAICIAIVKNCSFALCSTTLYDNLLRLFLLSAQLMSVRVLQAPD
mgnify:CR=1 FL=1